MHDVEYVNAVKSGKPRELAESQGFTWDPGFWPMVTASNGGVVAAARSAMADGVSGSLSSGLHHARAERGSGFCTFNGLVLAAKALLNNQAKSVLILDLDAHCGGGTHSSIEDDDRIRQIDVSVSPVDHYKPSGRNTLNMVRSAGAYLTTIRSRLSELEQSGSKPDLCLYNAGMDPEERCSIGGLAGITADILGEREAIVFEWAARREIPIAFVLAGGYEGGALKREDLVRLHRMTIQSASDFARRPLEA